MANERFHVKFGGGMLSPPDLFETKEQAHEFWLATKVADDDAYTLETVEPLMLSHLIAEEDIESAIRTRAAYLTGDDSYVDSRPFKAGLRPLMTFLSPLIDQFSETNNFAPEGYVVAKRDFIMCMDK